MNEQPVALTPETELTEAQAAVYLHMSVPTLRRLRYARRIAYYGRGRVLWYRVADLNAYKAKMRNEARAADAPPAVPVAAASPPPKAAPKKPRGQVIPLRRS